MNQTFSNISSATDDEITLASSSHYDLAEAPTTEQQSAPPLRGHEDAASFREPVVTPNPPSRFSRSLPLIVVAVLAAGALTGAAIGVYRNPSPPRVRQASSDETSAANAKTPESVNSSQPEHITPVAIVPHGDKRERNTPIFASRRMRSQPREDGGEILQMLRRVIVARAPATRGHHGKHKHDDEEGDDH